MAKSAESEGMMCGMYSQLSAPTRCFGSEDGKFLAGRDVPDNAKSCSRSVKPRGFPLRIIHLPLAGRSLSTEVRRKLLTAPLRAPPCDHIGESYDSGEGLIEPDISTSP